MLKFQAQEFVTFGKSIAEASLILMMAESSVNESKKLDETEKEDLKGRLAAVIEQCKKFGLSTSEALVKTAIGDLPETARELEIVMRTVRIELRDRLFLFVPTDRSRYFDEHGFGAEVATKFPSASYDIDEAAKCLALSRSTSAVFHTMRVMEIVLRAIHQCLGLPSPFSGNDRNWGNILNGIRDEIKRRKPFPQAAQFQEMYALLDSVKDAWRNSTMHIENKYTYDEAEHIFRMMRSFVQKVASRMDENGLPAA